MLVAYQGMSEYDSQVYFLDPLLRQDVQSMIE